MVDTAQQAQEYLNIIAKNTGEAVKLLGGTPAGGGLTNTLFNINKGGQDLIPTFRKLFRGFKKLYEVSSDAAKAQVSLTDAHLKKLGALSKSKKGLDDFIDSLKEQAKESKGSIRASDASTKTLIKLAEMQSAYIKTAKNLDDENLRVVESVGVLNTAIKNQAEIQIIGMSALDVFVKKMREGTDSGMSLFETFNTNKDLLKAVNVELDNHGVTAGILNEAFLDAGNDIDKFTDNVNDAAIKFTKSTDSFAKQQTEMISKEAEALDEHLREFNKLKKEMKDSGGGMMSMVGGPMVKILEKVAGAAIFFVTRMGNAASELHAYALDLGDDKSVGDLLKSSLLTGNTPEAIARFVANNRDVMTSLTKSSMLSAGDAGDVITQFGNVIQNAFGAIGETQLDMVSKSITALANMGVDPSNITNFKNYVDGIYEMARTSNKAPDELFSEFADMAQNPDFLAYLNTLTSGTDAVQLLVDEFQNLRMSVGMNADEFMKYRKQLASERNRTGVDRVVQGVMAANLAAVLGMSKKEQAIIQQGKAFPESYSPEQMQEFEATYADMQVRLANRETTLRKMGMDIDSVSAQTQLEIYSRESNVKADYALALQQKSGVPKSIQEQQEARMKAAGKGPEEIMKTTAFIKEIIAGLAKNPLGPVALAAYVDDIIDQFKLNVDADLLMQQIKDFSPEGSDTLFAGIAGATGAVVDGLGKVGLASLDLARKMGWITTGVEPGVTTITDEETAAIQRAAVDGIVHEWLPEMTYIRGEDATYDSKMSRSKQHQDESFIRESALTAYKQGMGDPELTGKMMQRLMDARLNDMRAEKEKIDRLQENMGEDTSRAEAREARKIILMKEQLAESQKMRKAVENPGEPSLLITAGSHNQKPLRGREENI